MAAPFSKRVVREGRNPPWRKKYPSPQGKGWYSPPRLQGQSLAQRAETQDSLQGSVFPCFQDLCRGPSGSSNGEAGDTVSPLLYCSTEDLMIHLPGSRFFSVEICDENMMILSPWLPPLWFFSSSSSPNLPASVLDPQNL
jgi:hypothetical protein